MLKSAVNQGVLREHGEGHHRGQRHQRQPADQHRSRRQAQPSADMVEQVKYGRGQVEGGDQLEDRVLQMTLTAVVL
jgi:hypothetical protein